MRVGIFDMSVNTPLVGHEYGIKDDSIIFEYNEVGLSVGRVTGFSAGIFSGSVDFGRVYKETSKRGVARHILG